MKSIWEVGNSITEGGKTLGYISATVADIERRSVKIHLFYWDAFLTFRVTTQVVLDCEATCGPAVRRVYFNTNLTNLSNRAG